MNMRLHKRVFVTAALLLSLAAGQQPQTPATVAIGSATIAEVKGQVSLVLPDGSGPAAQRGQVLPPGTRVETQKGSALLNLQDGSQLLLKSHARVVLKSPNDDKGFFLELLLGKIVVKVQKRLSNEPPFRMGTPTAVITVRGTRFEVEVTKKNKTLVYVYEGVVEVNGFGPQSRPVLIRPGFATQVGLNREPDEPRRLAPEFGDDNRGENRLGRPGEQDDSQRAPTAPRGQAPAGQEPD